MDNYFVEKAENEEIISVDWILPIFQKELDTNIIKELAFTHVYFFQECFSNGKFKLSIPFEFDIKKSQLP